jgi:hypothetical protein
MTATHGHHGHTFDAPKWFAAWSDNGGIAMLVGDRLYVSRLSGIDATASRQLDSLRASIHHAGAGEALAGLLRANSGMMMEAF